MAKARTKENHPWVQVAAFCDQILEDTTHTFSLIRIVDRVALPRPPDWDGKTPIGIGILGLLAFKAGDVKGQRALRLYHTSPDGKRKKIHEQQVEFLGKDVGTNVRLSIGFGFKTEGTHWIDVYVGKWLATRMPLTIEFRQAPEEGDKQREQVLGGK